MVERRCELSTDTFLVSYIKSLGLQMILDANCAMEGGTMLKRDEEHARRNPPT